MPWTDFRDNADWMSHIWGGLEWLLATENNHPWFTLPAVTILTVFPDYMHTKFLGTDRFVYGAILFMICYMLLPGTPEGNLAAVWSKIDAYYRRYNVKNRYGMLKLTMFVMGPGGYPALKGKAIEIRNFGPALLDAWRQGMNTLDDTHVTIFMLLTSSVKMDTILAENFDEPKLPAAAAALFMRNALTYCQISTLMANFNDVRLFNITPKFHYLLHIAHRSGHFNPAWAWCFMGEDYMMVFKRCAAMCCRGVKSHKASAKIAQKMMTALHYQLSGKAQSHIT